MKPMFYPRLALDGMRKNKRMYLPYLFTCIGMVMMHYIITFLEYNPALAGMPGGAVIPEILGLGGMVIAVFAAIFLFYTNSFLMRRRKKEFGLYHILGMGKRNIGFILCWESLMIAAVSLTVGLMSGIIFSKLAELGLIHMVQGTVDYTLTAAPEAVKMTLFRFAVIFLLLFLNGVRQVRFSSAVALLKSESVGERPPKQNWIGGVLGILLLGVAYYLAVTIENPLAALSVFFLAVLLVIAGSYLVMISGSVMICRILQRNKKYYYRANHFVSVSSMVYRMRRNGAGLASICILATMVLVMISSTSCLYFGGEDSLYSRYPREINIDVFLQDTAALSTERINALQADILEVAGRHGVTPEDVYQYRSISVAGMLDGETVETDVTKVSAADLFSMADLHQFYFISLSDYNAAAGTEETLADGEAMLYINRGGYEGDTLSFRNGQSFHITKRLSAFPVNGLTQMDIVSAVMLVVPDLAKSVTGLDALADYNGDPIITPQWTYCFDTGADEDTEIALWRDLTDMLDKDSGYRHYNCDCRDFERQDYYGLFGGLFYLGILLSIVFLIAAVLIIYYKQISEGYEDQARFEIMQKVGMTGREIRKSINSQLLTVFFLPLLLAACHLAFAFPMIRKLLLMFNLNNVALFAVTTVISVVVFSLFYMLVYRITSNAYYHIVSSRKEP